MEKHTKYEHARLIGARALQIAMGAPFFVKVDKEELQKIGYNPIRIAQKEFDSGVLPLSIKRLTPLQKKEIEEKKAKKAETAKKENEAKE